MRPYYQDDFVTLYHGDCLDVLSSKFGYGSFGGFVTDPPYTAAGGSTNGRSAGHSADTQFFLHWARDVFGQIRRTTMTSGCGFAFCDWRTASVLSEAIRPFGDRQRAPMWEMSQVIAWDRDGVGMGSPFRNSFEMIGFARGADFSSMLPRTIRNVWRFPYPYGAKEHHPAEKPVPMLEKLCGWVALHAAGYPVLDPFAGSGSTLVAASRKRIPIIGIEVEERYCEVAARRLSQSALALEGA